MRLSTVSILLVCTLSACGEDEVPFVELGVYLVDTERCPSVPVPRILAQAAYFHLDALQRLWVDQYDDDGMLELDKREIRRGILLLGGQDANDDLLADMWIFDVASAQRVEDPGIGPCPGSPSNRAQRAPMAVWPSTSPPRPSTSSAGPSPAGVASPAPTPSTP